MIIGLNKIRIKANAIIAIAKIIMIIIETINLETIWMPATKASYNKKEHKTCMI